MAVKGWKWVWLVLILNAAQKSGNKNLDKCGRGLEMGWTGRHPETGQPEPPRDVAHLHLLVSSTRVDISRRPLLLIKRRTNTSYLPWKNIKIPKSLKELTRNTHRSHWLIGKRELHKHTYCTDVETEKKSVFIFVLKICRNCRLASNCTLHHDILWRAFDSGASQTFSG